MTRLTSYQTHNWQVIDNAITCSSCGAEQNAFFQRCEDYPLKDNFCEAMQKEHVTDKIVDEILEEEFRGKSHEDDA